MKDGFVDGQYVPVAIHCRSDPVVLFPRLIGGHQMLAPILDPLDRPAKLEGGEAHQKVFRVQLAAHAEAPTDMIFV